MNTKNSAKSILLSILSALLAVVVFCLVTVLVQLIFYLVYLLLSAIPIIGKIVDLFIGLAIWPFKLSDAIVFYVSAFIGGSVSRILLDAINPDCDMHDRSCKITGAIIIIPNVISILLNVIGIFFGVPFDGQSFLRCVFAILFGFIITRSDV